MHPPSFPNFSQFTVLCGILNQGVPVWCRGIIYNLLFWNSALDFFPSFLLQAVECFLEVMVLDTFIVGLKVFPYGGKICILWPLWPYSHSAFCYEILPGLSFGCQLSRHQYSTNYVELLDYWMDFHFISGVSFGWSY